MPEPQAHHFLPKIKHVARNVLIASLAITVVKFGIFRITNSAAVLSDAMESVINVVASGFMVYTIWLSSRPADHEHPYGHGKIEFMAIGLEGWLILIAGIVVAYEAIYRFIRLPDLDQTSLTIGALSLGGVGGVTGILAIYVRRAGLQYDSPALLAHGKHLITDFFSTVGVLAGVVLVRLTHKSWLDPLIALIMASLILWTSWKLMWQSIGGLMDQIDPDDDVAIRNILDEEVQRGTILGYHKVRYRHSGTFHWVDMHLQVKPDMTVHDSHDVASRIELRIEQLLEQANATAHIEPYHNSATESLYPPDTT